MRNFLVAVGALLTFPLAILNWTSGIVGGVWLAFLGEWRLLVLGIIVIFSGTFLLSFVLMIGIGVAAVGVMASKVAKVLGYPFLAAAGLINFAIVTAATVIVFSIAVNARSHEIVWPYLLWSYAVATTPWTSMAQREIANDPNSSAIMWVFAIQFGAVSTALSVLVGNGYQSDFGMVMFFIPIALIGLLIGFLMTLERQRL